MAKRKMLQWMRERLNSRLYEIVSPAEQKTALDAAYKVAAPLVIKAVHEKYPLRDMKVCEKYGVAENDDCIQVQLSNGVVTQFRFAAEQGPLVVKTRGCRTRMYLVDETTSSAIEIWNTAVENLDQESKRRINAYRALISSANTLDDLLEIWPEAARIVPEANAVMALGPEQIALVKADQAERQAA